MSWRSQHAAGREEEEEEPAMQLVRKWETQAMKPIKCTPSFQEVKAYTTQQICARAPYPWMDALLTTHVNSFVKKHLEPLAMPMLLHEPNHSAFLTQFREEMPFAKPVVDATGGNTPTPLIKHNHMYRSSNAKILQEFFHASNRTPTHRKTNVWDELDFIAFNEGYNRTC